MPDIEDDDAEPLTIELADKLDQALAIICECANEMPVTGELDKICDQLEEFIERNKPPETNQDILIIGDKKTGFWFIRSFGSVKGFIDDSLSWVPFEKAKTFNSEIQAQQFAREKGIKIFE